MTPISTLPYEQSLLALIRKGESVELELKTTVPSPTALAQLISGFANASGGTIIIGVQEPDTVVGCDWQTVSRAFERAQQQLNPVPDCYLHQATISGKIVGVLNIAKSSKPVVSSGGAFVREGDRTRPITAPEIEQRLATPGAIDTSAISKALADNTATIERLTAAISRAQSLHGQWLGYAIGFVLGILLLSLQASSTPS
ncbi:AAA-4 family protein [Planctopirus limnophila DSM 3776]|uniref:AAA-4 family protein n=1 Tax=Planctopirus limnophila (strain ATCC 43296 / DSM 3776 / IFAM 1008 / Mu 290) TaxID=521674 RepID=D5SPG5_PLAL2|nr:RNA-binding domain-containing protein [Planctopirus limnophila]ADG66195.1 AAA-4 family protein [Planctopirus limnophila DSM 3776]